MNSIKMLYYYRIDVSDRIDVNKTNECDICHYWYFLHKGFKFQLYVRNECHVLLMMSKNLSDIAILNIKCSDYHCIVTGISKSEAINLMRNINLLEKNGAL